MASEPTTEHLWAWAVDCPLDPLYYGQIILTVRAGAVIEIERRQTLKPPRQKPRPPGRGEDRSDQPTPHS